MLLNKLLQQSWEAGYEKVLCCRLWTWSIRSDGKKYCAVDYGLGVSGVMVASLGARNGGSHQVRDLIQQLCDDITSY